MSIRVSVSFRVRACERAGEAKLCESGQASGRGCERGVLANAGVQNGKMYCSGRGFDSCVFAAMCMLILFCFTNPCYLCAPFCFFLCFCCYVHRF